MSVLFPGVLWLLHFLYSVSPHPVSSLHIYTFVVSQVFMAVVASQAGGADSSRAPGLTSGLQGSVNVHRGALLLVPQWQCISPFVFYILLYFKLRRVVLWYGNVCPGRYPSVCFPQFSPTCFNVLRWNFGIRLSFYKRQIKFECRRFCASYAPFWLFGNTVFCTFLLHTLTC